MSRPRRVRGTAGSVMSRAPPLARRRVGRVPSSHGRVTDEGRGSPGRGREALAGEERYVPVPVPGPGRGHRLGRGRHEHQGRAVVRGDGVRVAVPRHAAVDSRPVARRTRGVTRRCLTRGSRPHCRTPVARGAVSVACGSRPDFRTGARGTVRGDGRGTRFPACGVGCRRVRGGRAHRARPYRVSRIRAGNLCPVSRGRRRGRTRQRRHGRKRRDHRGRGKCGEGGKSGE